MAMAIWIQRRLETKSGVSVYFNASNAKQIEQAQTSITIHVLNKLRNRTFNFYAHVRLRRLYAYAHMGPKVA